jgi:hypothetical protein
LDAARLERRRKLGPSESAALDRYRVAERWVLAPEAPLTLELLSADEDRPTDRLRLGWLLRDQEALRLVIPHDRVAIARLDPSHGRPFPPDRPRVALAPEVATLLELGTADRPRVLLELLERFESGEVISATDPGVVALHAAATADDRKLKSDVKVSPGKLASGTLRNLLRAVGWKLTRVGQIHTRGGDRGACTYSAAPLALPEGVSWEALTNKWLAELRAGGQKNDPSKKELGRVETLANHQPRPSHRVFGGETLTVSVTLVERSAPLPWPSGSSERRSRGFAPDRSHIPHSSRPPD